MTLGLLALPTSASADDDSKTRSGDCSGKATYKMTLGDLDDDKDDGDLVKVRAVSPAGQTCVRAFRLDG